MIRQELNLAAKAKINLYEHAVSLVLDASIIE